MSFANYPSLEVGRGRAISELCSVVGIASALSGPSR